jgi:hypothetical protein
MDTMDVVRRIKLALRTRSGKVWSVTRGRGTTSCWLFIDTPPARQRGQSDDDRRADMAELGKLLGYDTPCHHQGVSVPASHAHYREYIDRAEGRTPRAIAAAYWD